MHDWQRNFTYSNALIRSNNQYISICLNKMCKNIELDYTQCTFSPAVYNNSNVQLIQNVSMQYIYLILTFNKYYKGTFLLRRTYFVIYVFKMNICYIFSLILSYTTFFESTFTCKRLAWKQCCLWMKWTLITIKQLYCRMAN